MYKNDLKKAIIYDNSLHPERSNATFERIEEVLDNVLGEEAKDRTAHFVGTTSDLTVYGLGSKSNKYNAGDSLRFSPDYMAVTRLMNSKFVEKEIV